MESNFFFTEITWQVHSREQKHVESKTWYFQKREAGSSKCSFLWKTNPGEFIVCSLQLLLPASTTCLHWKIYALSREALENLYIVHRGLGRASRPPYTHSFRQSLQCRTMLVYFPAEQWNAQTKTSNCVGATFLPWGNWVPQWIWEFNFSTVVELEPVVEWNLILTTVMSARAFMSYHVRLSLIINTPSPNESQSDWASLKKLICVIWHMLPLKTRLGVKFCAPKSKFWHAGE